MTDMRPIGSPDGSTFAYGLRDNDIFINNATNSGEAYPNIATFTEPTSDVLSVDFSYDSQWLVVGSKDNHIYFYKRDCLPKPVNLEQHCPPEYYQDSSDSCRFCALDMLGCRKCTNSTECLVCTDQYYLDANTAQCVLCIASIPACSGLSRFSHLPCLPQWEIPTQQLMCQLS